VGVGGGEAVGGGGEGAAGGGQRAAGAVQAVGYGEVVGGRDGRVDDEPVGQEYRGECEGGCWREISMG